MRTCVRACVCVCLTTCVSCLTTCVSDDVCLFLCPAGPGRQGSTVIEFEVSVPDGEVPNRVEMAELLLPYRTNGFPYAGTVYDVPYDPLINDGTAADYLSTLRQFADL